MVYACSMSYVCYWQNNNKGTCLECGHSFWEPVNVQWIERVVTVKYWTFQSSHQLTLTNCHMIIGSKPDCEPYHGNTVAHSGNVQVTSYHTAFLDLLYHVYELSSYYNYALHMHEQYILQLTKSSPGTGNVSPPPPRGKEWRHGVYTF